MPASKNGDLARQLVDRVLAGDADGVTALYDDEFFAWRNIDQKKLTRKNAVKILSFMGQLKNLRYDDVRVTETESGFVQQHIVRCETPSGDPVEVHVCMVGTVRNGKIVQIDEYMDSKQMAPLMGG